MVTEFILHKNRLSWSAFFVAPEGSSWRYLAPHVSALTRQGAIKKARRWMHRFNAMNGQGERCNLR